MNFTYLIVEKYLSVIIVEKECFVMKKLLSLLLATLSTIILVSCASQDKLDGDYYWIDTENGLRMSCHSLSKVLKVQFRRENTTNSSSIVKTTPLNLLVKMLQLKK